MTRVACEELLPPDTVRGKTSQTPAWDIETLLIAPLLVTVKLPTGSTEQTPPLKVRFPAEYPLPPLDINTEATLQKV
jgi:hypothetical protein